MDKSMDQWHGPGHPRAGTCRELRSLIHLKNAPGFNMVELVVAMTILAIGFMGVATLFPLGSASMAESGTQTVAVELAQQGLEELLQVPYTDEQLDPSSSHQDTTSFGEVTYIKQWVIQKDIPLPGCKQIEYTIIWDEDDDKGRLLIKAIRTRASKS